MEIKLFDKVKIKKTVKKGKAYNGYYVNDDMYILKGKELTVMRISTEESAEGVYKTYMLDGSHYGWNDDIIELY